MEVLKIINTIISFFANIKIIKETLGYIKPYFEKMIEYIRELQMPKDFSYQNDSFAEKTITFRFKNIIEGINKNYSSAVEQLGEKTQTLPLSYEAFFNDDFINPDYTKLVHNEDELYLLKSFYDKYTLKYKKNNDFIKNAPFIDVEHAFYFYVLDKLNSQHNEINEKVKNIMSDNMNGIFDPYKLTKKELMEKDINKGLNSSHILKELKDINEYSKDNVSKLAVVNKIIELSLNSNSCDLSQAFGAEWHQIRITDKDKKMEEDFLSYLKDSENEVGFTINYLVDNAGIEFFTDLVLGYLLLSNPALHINKIIFRVNVLPIFVSDVIKNDLEHTFKVVENCIERTKNLDKEYYREALGKIQNMFNTQKAEIAADFIWNMPMPYEEISKIKKYDCVFKQNFLIVKGDLNYRKLCRDKCWNYKNKLNNLTKYITCPTLVIRSYKSNLILDYDEKRFIDKTNEDDQWRINGKHGTILFMKKKG